MSNIIPFQKKVIEMFPDSYDKRGRTGIKNKSNLYKLLDCITPEMDILQNLFIELANNLDIDSAKNDMLTKLSYNLNQSRGQLADSALVLLLKAKAGNQASNNSIPDMIDILSEVLSDNRDVVVSIKELWDNPDIVNREPAAISVSVPLDIFSTNDITATQFIQVLQALKAGGVRIDADIQGTFIFGSVEEYGQPYEDGFADVDKTTGGTLGAFYDPENSPPLPI